GRHRPCPQPCLSPLLHARFSFALRAAFAANQLLWEPPPDGLGRPQIAPYYHLIRPRCQPLQRRRLILSPRLFSAFKLQLALCVCTESGPGFQLPRTLSASASSCRKLHTLPARSGSTTKLDAAAHQARCLCE